MSQLTVVIPAPSVGDVESLESLEKQSAPVHYLIETGSNPSTNRNRGSARAVSPLIGFINAHAILAGNWGEKVIEFFASHPEIDIAGGPQLNYANDPLFARASGDALSSPFATGAMSQRYKKGPLNLDADETSLTSANLVCRARVFDKVRFDETIYPGEDPKFLADAKSAGFKIAYVPDMVVFNRRRTTVAALAKQIFNYGKTRVQKDRIAQLCRKPVFFVPLLFLIYAAALPFLLALNIYFWLPILAYVAVNFLFSGLIASEQKQIRYVAILPFIFLIIHLAYGAGFLVGLWNEIGSPRGNS